MEPDEFKEIVAYLRKSETSAEHGGRTLQVLSLVRHLFTGEINI